MVICVIALVVLGFLSIFSAKYRALSKEAFNCVVRRLTFRPCETKLDQRIRSKITAKLLKRTPNLAKFVYKRFEILSWIFILVFLVSIIVVVNGVYNLIVYGTCDPQNNICIFTSSGIICGSEHCATEGCTCEEEGCTAPDYEACEGNCTCRTDTCG